MATLTHGALNNDESVFACPYCHVDNLVVFDDFPAAKADGETVTKEIMCCWCNAPVKVTARVDFDVLSVEPYQGRDENGELK